MHADFDLGRSLERQGLPERVERIARSRHLFVTPSRRAVASANVEALCAGRSFSHVTLCITRSLIAAIPCRPVRLPCTWRTNRASSRLSRRCVFRAHRERPLHAEARSRDRSPN